MVPLGFYTKQFAKHDGKTREGGGGHPIPFFQVFKHDPFFHDLFFLSLESPMTRDPFFSIKPSNSTSSFHSSLQASKQASKEERRKKSSEMCDSF